MITTFSTHDYCIWRLPRWVLLVVLAALLASNSAAADCTVTANSVSFGNYDTFSPTPTDGVGQVQVSCDPSAAYSIALSAGAGSYSQRQMSSGAALMYYNLYTGVSHTTIWGDGSGGSATVSGSGISATHYVYGRIPAGQNLTEGSYTDMIVVTLTF